MISALAGPFVAAACSATSGTAWTRTAPPPREPAGSRSAACPPQSGGAADGTRCASPAALQAGAHNERDPTRCRTPPRPPAGCQPRAKPRELGQHLLRIIDQPPGQQLVDARLYLRRWRYRASHGVGLLHRLAGLEGTYAVALTAPGTYLQQFWDATPRGRREPSSSPGPRTQRTASGSAHRRSSASSTPDGCKRRSGHDAVDVFAAAVGVEEKSRASTQSTTR